MLSFRPLCPCSARDGDRSSRTRGSVRPCGEFVTGNVAGPLAQIAGIAQIQEPSGKWASNALVLRSRAFAEIAGMDRLLAVLALMMVPDGSDTDPKARLARGTAGKAKRAGSRFEPQEARLSSTARTRQEVSERAGSPSVLGPGGGRGGLVRGRRGPDSLASNGLPRCRNPIAQLAEPS